MLNIDVYYFIHIYFSAPSFQPRVRMQHAGHKHKIGAPNAFDPKFIEFYQIQFSHFNCNLIIEWMGFLFNANNIFFFRNSEHHGVWNMCYIRYTALGRSELIWSAAHESPEPIEGQ